MSALKKWSKSNFCSGVLTLFGSQLAVKLLGLVYRLVITNIRGFGDLGNGYYNAGFQVYTLLLALSSVGIPNAISKLAAQAEAAGDHRRSGEIFRTAMVLFFIIGLLCAGGLYLGADFLARSVLRMDGVQETLRALSPAVLFVCLSSVLRGYYLGLGSAKAAGSSQVIEQAAKSTLTIVLVLALSGCSAGMMSAGANLATSIAAAASFTYLLGFHINTKRQEDYSCGRASIISASAGKAILRLSIPISAASIISSVGRVIDTGTITRGITAAFADGIPGQEGLPGPAELNAEAVRLMGILSKSDSLVNLPLALNIAFAAVLVPAISSAIALNRRKEAAEKIELSLLVSILLILPCAVGLSVLAEPIYQMIYPNAPHGYELLRLGTVSMVFAAVNQTIVGSLQGLGKTMVPIKALLCGAAAKVVLNAALIRIPSIGIYGAPIASAVCYLIAVSICLRHLRRAISLTMPVKKYLVKPILCSAAMGVVSRGVYHLLYQISGSGRMAVIASIVISAAFYMLAVLSCGILPSSDIRNMLHEKTAE